MKKINDNSTLKLVHDTFYKVFKGKDPFGAMFQDRILQRLILFPTEGYLLSQTQFNAAISANKTTCNSKFYISEIEGDDCFHNTPSQKYQCNHLECEENMTYEEYQKIPINLENAIYSVKGDWGILISHEGHAVIGGTPLFIQKFKEQYPDWVICETKFNEQWEYNRKHYNSDLKWYPDLINHIKTNESNDL